MNRYTPIIAGKPCTMLSPYDESEAAASCRDRFPGRFERFEDANTTGNEGEVPERLETEKPVCQVYEGQK